MILRPFKFVGRISAILAQRGSMIGMSDMGRYHTSWCCADIVYSDDLMTRSGGPKPSLTAFHSLSVTSGLGGGRSFKLPCSAPPSTQATIVFTCWSVSDISFLNFCTPTLRSMSHAAIPPSATPSLIPLPQHPPSSHLIP